MTVQFIATYELKPEEKRNPLYPHNTLLIMQPGYEDRKMLFGLDSDLVSILTMSMRYSGCQPESCDHFRAWGGWGHGEGGG
jgi:hypothetical protein